MSDTHNEVQDGEITLENEEEIADAVIETPEESEDSSEQTS